MVFSPDLDDKDNLKVGDPSELIDFQFFVDYPAIVMKEGFDI